MIGRRLADGPLDTQDCTGQETTRHRSTAGPGTPPLSEADVIASSATPPNLDPVIG